jgi:hypothetical protein
LCSYSNTNTLVCQILQIYPSAVADGVGVEDGAGVAVGGVSDGAGV